MKNTHVAWNKGKTGVYSPQTLERMSLVKMGKKFSEQHLKNLSLSHMGQRPGNFGKKASPETLKKMSISRKGKKIPWSQERRAAFKIRMSGINHPRWVSDRGTLQRYGDDNKDRRSSSYNDWRQQIRIRDRYACRLHSDECSGRLEVHHIIGWKHHPELRYDVNNGITLCHAHHPRGRAEEKRLAPILKELVSVSKDQF